jgi:uncharacterized OsmC-like protein
MRHAAKPPSQAALKALFEARAAAVRACPESARQWRKARVQFAYGLACEVEHEDRRIRVDALAADGGSASGPDPAQLMRASVGASLLQDCRIWAARLDVAIDDAWLEITCEYDVRAQLGVDSSAPLAWSRIRFELTVCSEAPRPDVHRVIDAVQRNNPMLALLSPAITREFAIELRRCVPG